MPFHTEERIIEAKFGADGNTVTGTWQRERIVRCIDCKFFGKNEACIMFPMQTVRIIHPSKDGFCAWGERQDTPQNPT